MTWTEDQERIIEALEKAVLGAWVMIALLVIAVIVLAVVK